MYAWKRHLSRENRLNGYSMVARALFLSGVDNDLHEEVDGLHLPSHEFALAHDYFTISAFCLHIDIPSI